MRRRRASFLPLVAMTCASCAGMPLTETGFLGDYGGLEPAPGEQVRFVPDEIRLERNPTERSYHSVFVDEVAYAPLDGEDHPSTDTREDLAESFRGYLEARLGEEYDLATEPGPGTLRIRAAVTAVNPSNVLLNIVTVILIVPVDMGGISGEVEVLDATTGERLVAFTALREGTPFLLFECFTRYGHARHGMDKWARMLADLLRRSTGPIRKP